MNTAPDQPASAFEKGRWLGKAQGEGAKSVRWLTVPLSALLVYRGLEFVGVSLPRSGGLIIMILLFLACTELSRRAKLLLCLALPSAYLLTYGLFSLVGLAEAEASILAFGCVFLPSVSRWRRAESQSQ